MKIVRCDFCGTNFERHSGRKMFCSVLCSFKDKVYQRGPDDCWPWTASKCSKQYGTFWNGKRVESAHRHAYLVEHGKIPKGSHVLHRCDNPKCCNPAHLFLGTNADNVKDKVRKGRAKGLKGSLHPHAKLDEIKVMDIRRRLADGQTIQSIGDMYGVTDVAISYIRVGKTWTHVR